MWTRPPYCKWRDRHFVYCEKVVFLRKVKFYKFIPIAFISDDILLGIREFWCWIPRSVLLTNGSGSGFNCGSDFFLHWF